MWVFGISVPSGCYGREFEDAPSAFPGLHAAYGYLGCCQSSILYDTWQIAGVHVHSIQRKESGFHTEVGISQGMFLMDLGDYTPAENNTRCYEAGRMNPRRQRMFADHNFLAANNTYVFRLTHTRRYRCKSSIWSKKFGFAFSYEIYQYWPGQRLHVSAILWMLPQQDAIGETLRCVSMHSESSDQGDFSGSELRLPRNEELCGESHGVKPIRAVEGVFNVVRSSFAIHPPTAQCPSTVHHFDVKRIHRDLSGEYIEKSCRKSCMCSLLSAKNSYYVVRHILQRNTYMYFEFIWVTSGSEASKKFRRLCGKFGLYLR